VRRQVALGIAIAFVLAAGSARANPVDAFGFGSRAAAMGGAATALADDGSAGYYNPAGLVRGHDLRVELGYRFAQPILRLNGHDVGVDASRGVEAALVAPGALGKFRYSFGVLLFLPDQRLFRIRSLTFQQPRFVYYDNRMQRAVLSANVAIQIIPGLYIGGGLTFMSRNTGNIDLKGQVAVPNPDDSQLTSSVNVDLLAVRYPQVGIMWEASPNLSFGISYRHSFTLDLDQTFRIDGDVGTPGEKPLVTAGYFQTHAVVTDLFQPWELTGGVAVRLRSNVLVAFDGTYARWSEFSDPAHNADIKYDIGMFNKAVKLSPPQVFPDALFHDIFIPHIGVEWRAIARPRYAIDVRGGYVYEASPAPEQIGSGNLVDNDKHTFSAGLGLELEHLSVLPRPLAIDFHVALTYLPSRANHKIDSLDPVGDYVSDGFVPQLGIELKTRFR
jgi:long-chain fatty acid transport protein